MRHLVAAYGHGIDRRDYDLLRTLYHDDAVDDHAPYHCGSASGYIDWLPPMMANWKATMHTAFSMLFVVNGDCAQVEIRGRLAPDGGRFTPVRGLRPLCRSL